MRAVAVFCGSQPGRRDAYVEAARALGATLARRGIATVYGGGHVGMMGAVADAALAAGGGVVGVIPRHLMRPEVAHQALTELVVVDSMHTRKRTMAERSDAFVVLPGGYGTFDETFEMVTWLQLGLQAKPVGVLNVDGYFDRLLDFVRHAVDEGFVRAPHRDLLLVERDPAALLDRLQERRGRPPPPSALAHDLDRA
ncbi:MAG TPA: TIGR00730 family Rossman fold protein [Burkholderiaceae bacterium]|nr:TIGR00730 family Rossman fold protein [Burkholderiaceae bacterium]